MCVCLCICLCVCSVCVCSVQCVCVCAVCVCVCVCVQCVCVCAVCVCVCVQCVCVVLSWPSHDLFVVFVLAAILTVLYCVRVCVSVLQPLWSSLKTLLNNPVTEELFFTVTVQDDKGDVRFFVSSLFSYALPLFYRLPTPLNNIRAKTCRLSHAAGAVTVTCTCQFHPPSPHLLRLC